MTVTVDTGLDIDIFEVLDFDFAPPCECLDRNSQPFCDEAAVWKIVTSCCGFTLLFCQKHTDNLLEDLNKYIMVCTGCEMMFEHGPDIILVMDRI